MSRTSRWGAAIGVICGAELIIVALLGGTGLAAMVRHPAVIVLSALIIVGAGVIVFARRRAERVQTE